MDNPPLLSKRPSSMFTMALSSTSNQELILPGLDTTQSTRSTFISQSSNPSSKKKFGRSYLHNAFVTVKNSNNFTNSVKASMNEKQSGRVPTINSQPTPQQSAPYSYGPPECLSKYLNLGDSTRKGSSAEEILESGIHLEEEEQRRMEMLAQFEKLQRVKLNNKMVNSLFLRNVDTEEIFAAITYESQNIQSEKDEEEKILPFTPTSSKSSRKKSSSSKKSIGPTKPRNRYQTFTDEPLLKLHSKVEREYDAVNNQLVFRANDELTCVEGDEQYIPFLLKEKPKENLITAEEIAKKGYLREPYRYKGVTYIEDIDGNPMPISQHHADHYFGYAARKDFFALYQKMSKNKFQLAPKLAEAANPEEMSNLMEASQAQDEDIQSEMRSFFTQVTSPMDNFSFYLRSSQPEALSAKADGKDKKGGNAKGKKDEKKKDTGGGKDGKGKKPDDNAAGDDNNSIYFNQLSFYEPLQSEEAHQYYASSIDSIASYSHLSPRREVSLLSKSLPSLPKHPMTSSSAGSRQASRELKSELNTLSILSSTQKTLSTAHTSSSHSNIASQGMKLSNSLSNYSTDFFRDLESLSSNDHVKQFVDRDLLSKTSTGKNFAKVRHTKHGKHKDRKQKRLQPQDPKQDPKRNPKGGKVILEPLVPPSHQQRHHRQSFDEQDTDTDGEHEHDHDDEYSQASHFSNFASKPHFKRASSSNLSTLSMNSMNSGMAKNGIAAWDQLNAPLPASPRTHYISACIREGVQPLPNIILRRDYTSSLDLSHFGMGDKMGRLLAECIATLPCIQSINLADNNLTDDSLQYLIESIIEIKSLKELNLSRNKIDGYSAEALSNFLSRPDCPIVRLTLQNADVDDFECDNFVQSLVSNEQLLELDLSSNLLGSAESLSTVDDTISTGGAAIAEFIKSKSCRLEVLKLAWNAIRLKSANILMEAIAYNHTITYLDLNCNGLGASAGEILGDSIIENRTLKTLLVNNNGFTSSACICLCIGVVENLALHHLEMNENPIGVAGAKMIMQVSTAIGNRISLQAKNCNTITVDEQCWYDPALPCGDYALQLHKPFDRAIAYHLLHLVASHATYIFEYLDYEPRAGSKKEAVKLIPSVAKDRELYFDAEQKHVLNGLRLLQSAASNNKLGKQLFEEADADNSGKLDKYELQEVLARIGFEIEEDRLLDIMAVFDVDGAGTIDLPEFLSLLRSQYREATLRIKEMIEYPILSPENRPHEKYIPPKTGTLYCKVIDGFVQKHNFYTLSSMDQQYAYNMAKGMGDLALMTEAIKHSKLRYEEAYKMYKNLVKEQPNKAELMLQLIPQMMYRNECRQLLSRVTHDKHVELNRVKLAFGVAFKPMVGVYNGYYCLDLSIEIHRVCLVRLIEQSTTINARRSAQSIIEPGRVGDTSQHQNWSSFRNEMLNGQPIIITPQLFTPMPKSGLLSFDFSTTERPNGSELPITDRKFCKVLNNISLLPTDSFGDGLSRLQALYQRTQTKSRDGKLFMPCGEFSVEHALAFGQCIDDFYAHLGEREELLKKGMDKENIRVHVHHDAHSPTRPGTVDGEGTLDEAALGRDEVVSLMTDGDETFSPFLEGQQPKNNTASRRNSVDTTDDLSIQTNPLDANLMPSSDITTTPANVSSSSKDPRLPSPTNEEEGNDAESQYSQLLLQEELAEQQGGADDQANLLASQDSNSLIDEGNLTAEQQLILRKQRIREQKQRLRGLLKMKYGVTKHAQAIRFLEVIEDTCSRLWMYCRHVYLLISLFQQLFGAEIGRTAYYGSYAVDLLITLFPRIIDLHNFEMLYALFSPRDCAALYGRIGFLNLFNPLKPEVTLELNLSRYEERLVAKMIVYLSVEEPGINLTYKRFQWKRELDPTPGWDVTEPWMTEAGLYTHGYFAFTYYSGEGRNKAGCIPEIPLRKALTQLTLVNENEIIDEGDSLPDEFVCTAKTHYQQNMDTWLNYLAIPQDKKIM